MSAGSTSDPDNAGGSTHTDACSGFYASTTTRHARHAGVAPWLLEPFADCVASGLSLSRPGCCQGSRWRQAGHPVVRAAETVQGLAPCEVFATQILATGQRHTTSIWPSDWHLKPRHSFRLWPLRVAFGHLSGTWRADDPGDGCQPRRAGHCSLHSSLSKPPTSCTAATSPAASLQDIVLPSSSLCLLQLLHLHARFTCLSTTCRTASAWPLPAKIKEFRSAQSPMPMGVRSLVLKGFLSTWDFLLRKVDLVFPKVADGPPCIDCGNVTHCVCLPGQAPQRTVQELIGVILE